MKRHIEFFARYTGFWMLVFLLMRLLFILFNHQLSWSMPFKELMLSFMYGLRLDLSSSAYLTVIPLILWLCYQFFTHKAFRISLSVYNIFILIVVFLISLIDAELYSYWGQKLNAYASSFAKFPKEMFSFSSGVSWSKLLMFVGISIILIKIFYDNITITLTSNDKQKWWQSLCFFTVFGALLFLMIRGNIGMSPINQSFAYFSDKPFLNHAAVNTTWNFIASLADETEDETKNPYAFTGEHSAVKITDSLYQDAFTGEGLQLSKISRPDIVLIILEGWTADVVGFTGGEKDVTPNLDALSLNSLTYKKFYASGNRTDKGLAAIISAQPALAKSSIINKIQKFSNLPGLPKSLNEQGYNSSFVYGGEAEFANMKAFWVNSGYKNITDIHQFNKAILPESWGVHDDELYKMLLKNINESASPKFITALTLSSHEPYKVPHTSKFTGTDEGDKYRNSVHFADKCLGDFLAEAQKQPWYKNTLIIIMPDHAHQEPLNRVPFEPSRFHTPFVVTGGALNDELKGISVSRVSQQTDVAPSLLHQLNINARSFNWGTNMFDTTSNGFATFTYDDGIGFINKNGYAVYDHQSDRTVMASGKDSVNMINTARAFHQVYYNEYLKR